MRGATLATSELLIVSLISIHAPLAGCDEFIVARCSAVKNFNPRTPCGVRRLGVPKNRLHSRISIHAPLAGCDIKNLRFAKEIKQFQSTHPLRGATMNTEERINEAMISIHAPLAGCDPKMRQWAAQKRYFNPRTPCGVRHDQYLRKKKNVLFQSTHPLRGATEKP